MRTLTGWILAIGTGASPLALLVDWSRVWRALVAWCPLCIVGMGSTVDSAQWAMGMVDAGTCTGCYCTGQTYTFIGSVDVLDVVCCDVCGAYDVVDTSEIGGM